MNIKVFNPESGASVETLFVATEDEKRNKEGDVTNAVKISIPVGSTFIANQKEAEFLLKTFGFLKNAGQTEEQPQEVVVDKELVEDELDKELEALEDEIHSSDTGLEDELGKLSAKGYLNLKGDERKRYAELKKALVKA